MDLRLRQIVSKAAGTYFIVTDDSQVAQIEAEAKMRLYFINTEKGPVNMLFEFAKGDTAGFTSIFGKGTRTQEKRGNFSVSTCLDALSAGPIAVINLRAFEDVDVAGITGLNVSPQAPETKNTKYTELFNRNGFWVPSAKNIKNQLTEQHLLNFGNVGVGEVSIIVTRAADITALTSEGGITLLQSSLDIDEYPALDFDMPVKDTFVDVYIFKNSFGPGVSTNKYYGHLFNGDGQLDLSNIDALAAISESGYAGKITGSLIPGLKSETDVDISIDTLVNQSYMQTGVICSINDDLLEVEGTDVLDVNGLSFFDETGAKQGDYLLSHVAPAQLTEATVVYPILAVEDNVIPEAANQITYGSERIADNQFVGSFGQGIRLEDLILGSDGVVKITNVEILDEAAEIPESQETYTKVKYTCSGPIAFGVDDSIVKLNIFTQTGLVKPTNLAGYTPRESQFTNGSAARQEEILNMMISPGIVKGIKNTPNIRYVVDCFKSFVEPAYKHQFGSLMISLDDGNKFVRAIINEPFVEDMEKSTNPLFKDNPSDVFQWKYLPDGGNKVYSTRLMTKFVTGADMCFFFGPGDVTGSIVRGIAGKVSNLFYGKTYAFDVVANESGYIDGITALELNLDDDDRAFCEKSRFNPVINFNGGNTIFGNLSGQKEKTAQQQIHNSELLAYVKESLYNLSKTEAFKKGNYDDYLRTETEATNFMEALALSGAIEANPIVICNASNNTQEIARQKIKLVHIEYTPVNALEKVVFDLKIK